jgi:hypothetical protein
LTCNQKSDARSQRSEDEKIEVGDQKTEVTGLRTGKDRDQKSEKNNGMDGWMKGR